MINLSLSEWPKYFTKLSDSLKRGPQSEPAHSSTKMRKVAKKSLSGNVRPERKYPRKGLVMKIRQTNQIMPELRGWSTKSFEFTELGPLYIRWGKKKRKNASSKQHVEIYIKAIHIWVKWKDPFPDLPYCYWSAEPQGKHSFTTNYFNCWFRHAPSQCPETNKRNFGKENNLATTRQEGFLL